MGERTCKVDGCAKAHYGLGYCRTHYRRFKEHGSTDLPQREPRGCQVDGCPEKHYSVGYCQLHYNRQKRTGSTELRATVARTFVCAGCDETFDRDPDKLGGTPPKWCPDCKVDARLLAHATWEAANRPDLVTEYVCKFCGCSFCNIVPDGKPRKACSACAGRLAVEATERWRVRNPEKAAKYKANGHMRRRAAKKGARLESVDRAVVYARHGWHCYLCDQAIDPSLHYRDPMYGTVDHVVPLLPNDGGPKGAHSYDNLRPAHGRCNRRKGNRRITRLL